MTQIELRVWLLLIIILLLLLFLLQLRELLFSGLKTGPTFLTDATFC